MVPALMVLACSAGVIGLLIAERQENASLRWVFKSAASIAFVMAAVSGGAGASTMGLALLTGLLLSAVGDVLLVSRADRLFLFGIGAFALAHIAYSSAFLLGGFQFGYEAAIAAGVTLATGLFVLRPMRATMGALRAPVAIYALIISAMVGLGVGHHVAAASPDSLKLCAGAIAFALSDIAVARDRFLGHDFANKAWGLPLYYGAQCLIAIAV